MKTFVKLQCDVQGESVLIYTEDRTTIYLQVVAPHAAGLITEYGLKPLTKRYVKAKITKDGQVELGGVTANQNW